MPLGVALITHLRYIYESPVKTKEIVESISQGTALNCLEHILFMTIICSGYKMNARKKLLHLVKSPEYDADFS